MIKIEPSWKKALGDYFVSEAFTRTRELARQAYLQETVYPRPQNVFQAFELTPFDQVRVVILGQDPYINPGQAMGLSFSVPQGTPLPPSLQNIYQEIEKDLGHPSACTPSGDLIPWAQQGVLLLNSILTVRAGASSSHQDLGWQTMTDQAIQKMSDDLTHLTFILWGNYARSKKALIDSQKHLILEAPHPSPLSAHRGFFGCRHFSQANAYLESHGYQPIRW